MDALRVDDWALTTVASKAVWLAATMAGLKDELLAVLLVEQKETTQAVR